MDRDKIPNQFSGLDMEALIGGPLKAAHEAQSMLASAVVDHNERAGLEEKDEDKPTVAHKKH